MYVTSPLTSDTNEIMGMASRVVGLSLSISLSTVSEIWLHWTMRKPLTNTNVACSCCDWLVLWQLRNRISILIPKVVAIMCLADSLICGLWSMKWMPCSECSRDVSNPEHLFSRNATFDEYVWCFQKSCPTHKVPITSSNEQNKEQAITNLWIDRLEITHLARNQRFFFLSVECFDETISILTKIAWNFSDYRFRNVFDLILMFAPIIPVWAVCTHITNGTPLIAYCILEVHDKFAFRVFTVSAKWKKFPLSQWGTLEIGTEKRTKKRQTLHSLHYRVWTSFTNNNLWYTFHFRIFGICCNL